MAYGNFNRGGFNNGAQNRFGGNRGGGKPGGGADSLKDGKGRAFPNTQGKEGGPFAGGNVRVGGELYRISLFLNVNAKNFNNKNAQNEAIEITQELIQMLDAAGLTVGITVQSPEEGQARGGNRSFSRQAQSRPTATRRLRDSEEDEPEETEEEETTTVTPWAADDEDEPEVDEEVPAPKARKSASKAAAAPKTKTARSKK